MKVAVSAYQDDLNGPINPRFGRCDYLLIVDTDDMGCEAVANENKDLTGGAGIQTATFVISKGVDCVLTGDCGPNAMQLFRSANVAVYTGQAGPVMDAVNRLKQGNLGPSAAVDPADEGSRPSPDASSNGSARGTGGGRGMGGRGCGGMGQGRGGGCGMGRRG